MAFWNRSKKDEYLADARKAKRRGEFDRAGDYYYMADDAEAALAMYTKGGHHKLAGQLLEKQGKKRKAAEQYIKAKDNRSAARLYEQLGDGKKAAQLYVKLGDTFKAAQLEEELRAHRRAGELYLKGGHKERAAGCFAHDGDFAKAAEVLEQHLIATRSVPMTEQAEKQWISCAQYHVRAGSFDSAAAIHEELGRHAEAAKCFEEAGQSSRAIEAYLKAREPERAAELAEKAADGSITPSVLAELYYSKGEWLRAAALFVQLNDPLRAAECFQKGGEKLKAAEHYETAGEIELAAELFYGADEFSRASAAYEQAMQIVESARAAQKAGEFERAAELFERAQDPIGAAGCWSELDKVDRTIAVLQQVEKSDENFRRAAMMLAEAFVKKGHLSIAREKYQVAIDGQPIDSSSIDAHYGLAVLLEEQGEFPEALKIQEQIVALNYGYEDSAKRIERLRSGPPPPPPVPSPSVGTNTSGSHPALLNTTDTVAIPVDAVAAAAAGALSQRYEVVGRLGTSARGDVFKAWDSSLGRTVVLKKLVPPGEEEGLANRYVHEAQQASKLHHQNIATIYDALELPEGRVVAMEYVFGQSLRDLLKTEGHLSPGRAIEFVGQILHALQYAHGLGVLHRNLRPENVLIAEKSHVKLTDFGMNRRYSDMKPDDYTENSPLHYISPEQMQGEKVEPTSDIYSVGCILYEMLVGRPPFVGADCAQQHLNNAPTSLRILDADIPQSIDDVVLKCLAKAPGDRYSSAEQVYDALRQFDFVPGQRIGDRYEIIREIGSGGMGKVYLAMDLELQETIAMKVLRPEFGADATLEQRFIREIKLARKIAHPSVVKVYDFGKWKELKYITMEFIDGVSVEDYVKAGRNTDIGEICRFIIQICDALDAAHRLGVTHRDIKPQNLLLTSDLTAKIVDFGIARLDAHEDLTSSRHIVGSPKYMSPEQISGKSVDHRTDIYSLGVVMYYCFTGVEPFTATETSELILKQLREAPIPPCQVNPDLPPWLEMIILKCMVKDPRGRYQRISDVARELATNHSQ